MFSYEDISFRVIEREDLDVLRNLHNDQSTWENLLNIDFVDEESQLGWWKNLCNMTNDKRYVICYSETPKIVIGRIRIQNINYEHNNCEVGLDILSEYRGKGYGVKSYEMLFEYLFKHLNMNMVYLKVADFNPNAKKLYEKVGFIETGKFPHFFYRHGQYRDYIIMCITKENYFKKLTDLTNN
jgi:diamine N-acetyltransferase